MRVNSWKKLLVAVVVMTIGFCILSAIFLIVWLGVERIGSEVNIWSFLGVVLSWWLRVVQVVGAIVLLGSLFYSVSRRAWRSVGITLAVFLFLFAVWPVPMSFGRGIFWTSKGDQTTVQTMAMVPAEEEVVTTTMQSEAVATQPAEKQEEASASPLGSKATSDFTVSGDVQTQLQKLGYDNLESFAKAWGLILGFNPANAEVDPREVTICPFEDGCVRLVREKDTPNRIIPYRLSSPANCWLDGFRHEPGILRPGNYEIPEKSGVPPGFTGLIEGITIRPCHAQPTSVVPSTSAATEGGIITIQAENLNVRSGPGTEYPVIGKLTLGQRLPERSRSGSWVEVTLPNGQTGWVAGWLTSVALPAPQAQANPTATTVPSGMGGSSASSGTSPTSVVASVSVNWQKSGSEWVWNTYSNGNGQPVEMTLMCPQDGEYVENGVAHSPIPAGVRMVTGITARPCQ